MRCSSHDPAGSADLWVPSVNCTSSYCSKKDKYNSASSSSGAHKGGKFSIQYGDGSTVSGPVYTDTVSVAGVTVKNQYFSPVTTISASFGSEADDGILGLAFPAISNLQKVCSRMRSLASTVWLFTAPLAEPVLQHGQVAGRREERRLRL